MRLITGSAIIAAQIILHKSSKSSSLEHLTFDSDITTLNEDIFKMVTMDYNPEYDAGQESYILCADCGTVIPSSNGAGLCKHPSCPLGG